MEPCWIHPNRSTGRVSDQEAPSRSPGTRYVPPTRTVGLNERPAANPRIVTQRANDDEGCGIYAIRKIYTGNALYENRIAYILEGLFQGLKSQSAPKVYTLYENASGMENFKRNVTKTLL